MKNGTPLWREAQFSRQNAQNTTVQDKFLKLGVEKKKTRPCGAKRISKANAQNTTFAEQFLNFRCRKIARRCGAKHTRQSKCYLFEAQMSKN